MDDGNASVVRRGKVVPVGDSGLRGPRYFDFVAYLPEHPRMRITGRVSLLEEGVYEMTDLRMRGLDRQPISSELVRKIPIRTIVQGVVGPALRMLNVDPPYLEDSDPEKDRMAMTAFTY